MITLYTFGPGLRLPDPSPFVLKAMTLLQMAGISWQADTTGFRRAPKGKLPYIDDGGTVVADSTLIRWHLEQRHGADFDGALDSEGRGVAWAVEKMLEEHLYWAIVESRWCDDGNFERGPAAFFDAAPAPVRPLVKAMVRRQVRQALKAQGLGRHSAADLQRLAARDIEAVAGILGERTFLMGEEPCGADATVFAFMASSLCPVFETPLRNAAGAHRNVVDYVRRGMERWFPDNPWKP